MLNLINLVRLVTSYLPCVRVYRVHISPLSSRESSAPISRVLPPSLFSLLSFLFHPFYVHKKTTENIGLIRDLKERQLHEISR